MTRQDVGEPSRFAEECKAGRLAYFALNAYARRVTATLACWLSRATARTEPRPTRSLALLPGNPFTVSLDKCVYKFPDLVQFQLGSSVRI